MKSDAATNNQERRCQASRADGVRCRAKPLRKREYCFWHDPAQVGARKAAGKLGGSRGRLRTLPADTPETPADSAARIVKLLSKTISQTLTGEIDPKVANAVGYLSGVILRAREQEEFENRITEIEERLAKENKR